MKCMCYAQSYIACYLIARSTASTGFGSHFKTDKLAWEGFHIFRLIRYVIVLSK